MAEEPAAEKKEVQKAVVHTYPLIRVSIVFEYEILLDLHYPKGPSFPCHGVC